jgi:NAD(P)-dependent dehydrogenase (short-subunit alcohol dehydrogenase family)
MTRQLEGKTAMVTGAASGIGRAVAARFLAEGANVVAFDRVDANLDATAGGACAGLVGDVRSAGDNERAVALAIERFGRLDVLVANAGGAPAVDAATVSPRFHEKIIQLNLVAPLHCAQRANAAMQQQPEGGVVLFITSVSGMRPSPGTAAYGAAKAGLISLAQSLAVEWAPKVRVAAAAAGMVRTEQAHLHYGDEAAIAAVGATVPLGRLAEPADVGDACLYLASPLARYVSGATLLLHGGGEKPAFLAAAKPARE